MAWALPILNTVEAFFDTHPDVEDKDVDLAFDRPLPVPHRDGGYSMEITVDGTTYVVSAWPKS